MMNVLVVVNDQPYGSERPYNALRLASALSKRDGAQVRVFLLGDAVACAVADQRLPDGHYHLDRMLKGLLRRAEVAAAAPAWTPAACPRSCSWREHAARRSTS